MFRGLVVLALVATWTAGGPRLGWAQAGYSSYPAPAPLPPSPSAAPPATSGVTYTPMRRPGAADTPSMPPRPVPPAAAPALPPPPAPPWPAASPVGPSFSASPARPAAPWPPSPGAVAPSPAALRPPATPAPATRARAVAPRASEAAATSSLAATASPPRRGEGRRSFGLSLDVGLPDGLNAGLVVLPARWIRLGAALGTNSASLAYRGGVTLVPAGVGPSFTLEVGHCNMAPTNGLVRSVVGAPQWVSPYVQELGYTFVNAHLGFDVTLARRVVLFLHGGYSYLMGTVRASEPVVIDQNTGTTVTIAEDGRVYAGTLSAKLGLIVLFGGS